MLSEEQRQLVRRRGITTHQDHDVMSLVRGEASLAGSTLTYFDGRALFVCGQALRDQPAASAADLRMLMEDWLERPALDYVTYLGPAPVRIPLLARRGFPVVSVEPRIPHAAELFLEVSGSTASRRRRHRRAGNGLVGNWRTDGGLLAAHLALIEGLYRGTPLTAYLADNAFGLLGVLTRPSTVLLEAWEGEVLRGFVAVHEPFERIVVGLFLARDRGCPRVGDYLYGQMLDYAASIRAELVNLGPSPTESHFEFKLKWGGIALVPPYYICTWRRRGCRSAPRTWMRRILRLR